MLPSHTSENNDKTCNADIIAIHGLNGHPFKTWTFQEADGGRKCFWLKDLLLERLPGARIFTYSYNAAVSFSDSISSLHDWAENLLECLMVERNQPPEVCILSFTSGSNNLTRYGLYLEKKIMHLMFVTHYPLDCGPLEFLHVGQHQIHYGLWRQYRHKSNWIHSCCFLFSALGHAHILRSFSRSKQYHFPSSSMLSSN